VILVEPQRIDVHITFWCYFFIKIGIESIAPSDLLPLSFNLRSSASISFVTISRQVTLYLSHTSTGRLPPAACLCPLVKSVPIRARTHWSLDA